MSLNTRLVSLAVLVLAAGIVTSGCEMFESSSKSDTTASTASLYDRLGGEAAIKAVVDDFVTRAAQNPKVNFFRKGQPREWKPSEADVSTFKARLVEFIGMATGGPQKYEGKDMKTVHTGMKVTNDEFNALAADLTASLNKHGVQAKEQAELIAIVETTRKDIVE